MDYTIYQIIILIDDTLNKNKKIAIVKEIKNFIEKRSKEIVIQNKSTRALAYKIKEHEKAWFITLQMKLKEIGSIKRIKEIEEKLNTYEEIIQFKIVETNKEKI